MPAEILEPAAAVEEPEKTKLPAVSVPPVRPQPAMMPRRNPMAMYRYKTAWKPVAIAASMLLCLGGIEYQVLKVSAVRSAVALGADYAPALRVERRGSYLRVNWNRNAPSVLRAQSGALRITDGAETRELPLDAEQVRTGSLAYRPVTGDVSFRFDLVDGRTTVSESLRVIEPGPALVGTPQDASLAPLPVERPAAPHAKPDLALTPAWTSIPVEPPVSAAGAPVYAASASVSRTQPIKRGAHQPSHAGWYDDGL